MYHENEIRKMSEALALEKRAELDIWRVPEDLAALRQDIAQALAEKTPEHEVLLAEYDTLMRKEQVMLDPYAAYIAGMEHRGEEYWKAFISYMRDVDGDPDNRAALRERDKLFYGMCDILAGDERRLLLTDYNEIFRQYHGIINQHINRFFDMGYHGVKSPESGAGGL